MTANSSRPLALISSAVHKDASDQLATNVLHQGQAVAAAVACRLVSAFKELRQLEVLVKSLLCALASLLPADVADVAGVAEMQSGHDVLSAATSVVRQRQFLDYLRTSVQHIPPGKYIQGCSNAAMSALFQITFVLFLSNCIEKF
jgi:hypothetical protein